MPNAGTAGVAMWLLFVLLEAGTHTVFGVCDYGETNFTTAIMEEITETKYVTKTEKAKTRTCWASSWFVCRTKYRMKKYQDIIQTVRRVAKYVTRCCPGYSMANSSSSCKETGCVNGTYGKNCSYQCSCPDNALQTCEQESGNCTCLPGWHGPNCTEECDQGYYGLDCQSECHCKNNATCNRTSGKCQCQPGWEGHFCETACSNNTYGNMCNETCQCNGSQVCNHVTGKCDACKPGTWKPPDCKACPEWKYGLNCSFECPCEKEQTKVCDQRNGQCHCKDGFLGDDCKSECPLGKYGFRCNETCENCDTGACDNVDGTCYDCYGKRGNCSEDCAEGTYGFDCLWECQCNSSHSNGTCDPCSGICNCDPGWTGLECDIECPATMKDTPCQSVEIVNACDFYNTTWSCSDGWTGSDCTKVCPAGTYGHNCSGSCTCNENAICNPVNGNCFCNSSFGGEGCMKASPTAQEDGPLVQNFHIYIFATAGAVLLVAIVAGAVVCIKRRNNSRVPDKKQLSETCAEIEMQSAEQNITYGTPKDDSSPEQNENLNGANLYTDTLGDTRKPSKEHVSESVEEVNEEAEAYVQTDDISDQISNDEEHYVDVDSESNNQRQMVTSKTSADGNDDQEGDYDTYDHCVKDTNEAVPKVEESYDKFENVRPQENYDVIPKTVLVDARKMSIENYNTFEDVRQLSKENEKANENKDKRVSDPYDRLNYQDKKESDFNFDTSLYNIGAEIPNFNDTNDVKGCGPSNESHSATGGSQCRKDKELTLDSDNDNDDQLIERVYEDCLDEITNDTKAADDDHAVIYESVSDESEEDEPLMASSHGVTPTECYENYNLPDQSHRKESQQPKQVASDVQTSADTEQTKALRSKERKTIDYEPFELKLK